MSKWKTIDGRYDESRFVILVTLIIFIISLILMFIYPDNKEAQGLLCVALVLVALSLFRLSFLRVKQDRLADQRERDENYKRLQEAQLEDFIDKIANRVEEKIRDR